jgi:hypothetical protein
MDMELEFPAKLLALSKNKDKLAVYTINGELRLYATQPNLTAKAVIKTGYIKSFEFLTDTQIIGTDIKGSLFLIDFSTSVVQNIYDIARTIYPGYNFVHSVLAVVG